jgi:ABC-type sulfate/molybdate transport systems ATPase subunit
MKPVARSAERNNKGPARVVFDQVTKRYGSSTVAAVDRVSLDFPAGKLVTLLGPSGCGKTTTLRMIAGLEMASSGRILIGGDDVTKLPATARDVSMVFQSYALFPHMTVMENVSYGLKMSGFAKDAIVPKANDVLKQLGLDALAARYPNELSGGQQQRVAVARAIVLEPRVLLFDEPLSNLDAKLRRYVRQEIRDLQQALGLTVVYVTHDQEEALAVSDTIVVMNNAVIAQTGTPRTARSAADPFCRRLHRRGECIAVRGGLRRWRRQAGAGPARRPDAADQCLRRHHRPAPCRGAAEPCLAAAGGQPPHAGGHGAEGHLRRRTHGIHRADGAGRAVRDGGRDRQADRGRHVGGAGVRRR